MSIMDNEEKTLILDMYFKQRMTIHDIGVAVGRKHHTILKFIRSMTDTTEIAQRMVRARSLELTQRVLDKADVSQAIDILSRPNVGVLKPLNKNVDGPQIHISVNTESIGAVSIGSPSTPLTLPGDSAKLVGTGGTHGGGSEGRATGAEGYPSGGPDHEGGHEIHPEAGTGLRGTPTEPQAPSGPVGVARNQQLDRSGRQGRVGVPSPEVVEALRIARAGSEKDRTRVAIVNKARPKSSINLRYDIVEDD